jgi:serine/threonine-protein kinase
MTTDSNSLAVSAKLRAALGYYRLVSEIGRGGMAAVFLALFPNGDGTSRKIVLKQLHPELVVDEDFRAMFEDEARVATRLHHENVVETYDTYCDLDLCVLVMEFLDGQTLSRVGQRARKMRDLPLSIHLHILAGVLAGLHYVHELRDHDGKALGIVHRDVTPSNVFVTYDGRVKLVDFGIAKAKTRVAETRMGVLKGKLSYMSPEAVRGESVDRRSDIFSVGVMLWEAATGLRFWQDHDEIAVFRRLASGDLPLHRPGVQIENAVLLRIAERALALDPSDRYDSAEQMQQELEDLLVQLGTIARAPALSAYLKASFAAERAKFQQVVDHALAGAPARPASQRRLVVNAPSDSSTVLDASEPLTTVSSASGTTLRGASYDVPLDADELPNFRPRRRGVLLGAAAIVASVSIAIMANSPTSSRWSWQPEAVNAAPRTADAAELPVAKPTIVYPASSTDPAAVGNLPLAAKADASSAAAAANLASEPPPTVPSVTSPPAPAVTARPIETPAFPTKARRDKRAPEREDPWGI